MNRLYACFQLTALNKDIAPIKTFNQWKEVNRHVKKGERALELCMPVNKTWYKFIKDKKIVPYNTSKDLINKLLCSGEVEKFQYKEFIFKKYWFSLSQTNGQEFNTENININWNKDKALKELSINEIPFQTLNGNAQG